MTGRSMLWWIWAPYTISLMRLLKQFWDLAWGIHSDRVEAINSQAQGVVGRVLGVAVRIGA